MTDRPETRPFKMGVRFCPSFIKQTTYFIKNCFQSQQCVLVKRLFNSLFWCALYGLRDWTLRVGRERDLVWPGRLKWWAWRWVSSYEITLNPTPWHLEVLGKCGTKTMSSKAEFHKSYANLNHRRGLLAKQLQSCARVQNISLIRKIYTQSGEKGQDYCLWCLCLLRRHVIIGHIMYLWEKRVAV